MVAGISDYSWQVFKGLLRFSIAMGRQLHDSEHLGMLPKRWKHIEWV